MKNFAETRSGSVNICSEAESSYDLHRLQPDALTSTIRLNLIHVFMVMMNRNTNLSQLKETGPVRRMIHLKAIQRVS
jgi:hypothetical protein